MICKIFKEIWMILAFALAVWCIGCSGSDDSTTSEQGGDFTPTPPGDVQSRIKALELLLPEGTYKIITAGSRDNPACREGNRDEFVPPLSDKPNGQWYYTYRSLIQGMAELEEFADEGDENKKKLEIAAFLANIAQETGTNDGDKFGGPGCFIQEIGKWKDPSEYNSKACGKDYKCAAAGYYGKGPHQLSWDYNYLAFGETMKVGKKYLDYPDLLTTNPDIGIAGSIWFWGHADLGSGKDPEKPFKPSAHDVAVGKWKPSDDDKACGRTKADFGVIINIINGGLECGTTATAKGRLAAKNRVKYLEAIAEEMGVTIPAGFLDDCSSQKNFAQCVSYRPTPTDPKSRCGTNWADANSNCRSCCISNEDCPGESLCYGELSKTTPSGETCSCEN